MKGLFHHPQEVLAGKGFLKVGHAQFAVARPEISARANDAQAGRAGLQALDQLVAVHVRHHEIRHDEVHVGVRVFDDLHRLPAVEHFRTPWFTGSHALADFSAFRAELEQSILPILCIDP